MENLTQKLSKLKIDPLNEFMNHLITIIEKPPYLIFIFVSPVLLIITLIWQKYFNLFFIFFIYSVVGIIFRHAVKDFRSRLEKVFDSKKFQMLNLWLTGVYQIVNLILAIALIMIIVKNYALSFLL